MVPEDDSDGNYLLVVKWIPWTRTEKGQRIKEGILAYTQAVSMFGHQTHDRIELVKQLEQAFIGITHYKAPMSQSREGDFILWINNQRLFKF